MADATHAMDRKTALARLDALSEAVRRRRPDVAEAITGLALHVPPRLLPAMLARAETVEAAEEPLADLMDVLIEGDRVHLWGASLRFQTRAALLTIADEILIRREYQFRSAMTAPTVIDAGANIGLATYFAKRVNGAGRVICFEPNPATFALLEANVAAAKWADVELHRAALAAEDGAAELSLDAGAPLAASIAPRGAMREAATETVRTLSLRPFLAQPVGLLKMDIEGAEADVLEACANDLGQVENIFVEVHPVQGVAPSLLARVLAVLEQAGFMIHVARSPWSESVHRTLPLMQAHRGYSLSVYGTRRSG